MSNIGRNDPCPCGSGKKYKKCCLNKSQASTISFNREKIREIEGELVHTLLKFSENKYSQGALIAAWQDFVIGRDINIFDIDFDLGSDLDIEPDSPFERMTPEFETIFIPWFLFNWVPDSEPYFEDEEDIEPTTFPEKSIIASYLEKKQKYLPPFTLAFIEQACSQPFSYYLITHVIPGKQLTVKDIFLEQEITIDEIQDSESLTVGAIVFARVITLAETYVFFGMAPYIIPEQFHNHLIGFREAIETAHKEIDFGLLGLYNEEFRDTYFEIREQLLNLQLPEFQNTDDEPLPSVDILYSLNCSLSDAFEALKTLSLIPPHELLQDAKYNSKGELLSLEFAWLEKNNKQNADWDNTVKGHMILEDQELKINVNSPNRAEQIRSKISRRLGNRATFETAFYQPGE